MKGLGDQEEAGKCIFEEVKKKEATDEDRGEGG